MATIELTTENFSDTVGDAGIVLLDVVLGKVDTEARIELA